MSQKLSEQQVKDFLDTQLVRSYKEVMDQVNKQPLSYVFNPTAAFHLGALAALLSQLQKEDRKGAWEYLSKVIDTELQRVA